MNIYLSASSVLLVKSNTIANHADTFLRAVLTKHPSSTYWLLPHNESDSNKVKAMLTSQLKPETAALLDKIKMAYWHDTESDAIDFKQDFLWFGNDLWPEDLKALEKHEAVERFILVDFAKDPDILQKLAEVVANSPA